MPRPIDAIALCKVFMDELKKHPLPKEPGLARYRATVWLDAAGFFITMLTRAPTIETEQVIRCKDCKHRQLHGALRWCAVWKGFNGMGDEGFCNYAERRAGK